MHDYRLKSKEGDYVELPNGSFGIIKKSEIIMGGNVKEITIKLLLCGIIKKTWYYLRGKDKFYDHEINKLQRLDINLRLRNHPYR